MREKAKMVEVDETTKSTNRRLRISRKV